MSTKEYDVIIVGGGAAGLTASIYTSRRMLTTLVVTKSLGGQAALTSEIENYPGRGLVDGFELMNDFKQQAEKFGAEIITDEVKKIKEQGENFLVRTYQQQFLGRAIILAFGLTPKDLGVPGEQKLQNKGVSYCATCDAPLFKNKTVVVVGGASSALDATELLSKIAKKVYLIHRGVNLNGEEILKEKIKEKNNVEIILNTEVKEIKGKNLVSAVKIKNNQTVLEKEIKCDGVFIEIGYISKVDLLEGLVALDNRRQIKISRDCETSHPGIFAAGDITDITYKQIVISAGEGAKAGLQAYKYLQHKSTRGISTDWGRVEKK